MGLRGRPAGQQTPPGAPSDPVTSRAGRHQRIRLLVLAMAAASYGLDALWLGVYAALGATSPSIPMLYLLAGLGSIGFYALVIVRGWNLRAADPDLTLVGAATGYLIQLLFLQFAPEVGIVFLTNIFIVAAFGALSMNTRQFSVSWLVVTTGVGFVLVSSPQPVVIPDSTWALRVATWLMFCSSVGRVVFLSRRVTHLRDRLRDRNSALRTTMNAVEHLARVDELTQAWNRRAIMACLEEEASAATLTGEPICVAMFDIDHFKQVNDRYGHLVGDQVLTRFTEIATASLRQNDRLGRYGGEEFLLVLRQTPLAAGAAVVERIRDAVQGANWASVQPGLAVTVSVGVTELQAGDSVESLCRRADAALYEAKRSGRNQVRVDRSCEAVCGELDPSSSAP